MPRADIQGLRFVGALLVAVFHIFQWGVSGGVDIFMTVSGFFLWGTVVKLVEVEAGYSEHYNRFLKRTAPQAILTIVGVLIAAFVLVSPVEWIAVLRDAFFSILFLQNYWLAANGQDYLAREEGLSLFQHYWAVSVIAQVYFLFPCLALVAVLIARVLRRNKHRTLIGLTAGASALSFLWAMVLAELAPEFAYFDTLSRLWQFGAGALAANFVMQNKRSEPNDRRANLLSWMGLLAVFFCGIFLGRSFPGAASVWPTSAALLILIFSRETSHFANAGAFLSHRWLSSFGRLSFGVYLWHWPIYAVYFRYNPDQSFLSMVLIVGAATVLAAASTSLVDRIGGVYRRTGRDAYGLSLTTFVTMALVGGSVFFVERAIVWDNPRIQMLSHPITGVPLALTTVRNDRPVSNKLGCHQRQTSPLIKTCSFGDITSDTDVFLIGGSHSAQFLPAFQQIAEDEGFHLVTLFKNACRFFDPRSPGMSEYRSVSCREWNLNVMDYLAANTPDIVITLANTRGDEAPVGIRDAITAVVEMGVTVIALRDTPDMQIDIPVCISQGQYDRSDCRIPRNELLDDLKYRATIAALPLSVIAVDINDKICPEIYCEAVQDGTILWRDSHHLTATYSKKLTEEIWLQIAPRLVMTKGAPLE